MWLRSLTLQADISIWSVDLAAEGGGQCLSIGSAGWSASSHLWSFLHSLLPSVRTKINHIMKPWWKHKLWYIYACISSATHLQRHTLFNSYTFIHSNHPGLDKLLILQSCCCFVFFYFFYTSVSVRKILLPGIKECFPQRLLKDILFHPTWNNSLTPFFFLRLSLCLTHCAHTHKYRLHTHRASKMDTGVHINLHWRLAMKTDWYKY